MELQVFGDVRIDDEAAPQVDPLVPMIQNWIAAELASGPTPQQMNSGEYLQSRASVLASIIRGVL